MRAVRSLLGDDFVLIPSASVQDSGFGIWHKDTTSQEQNGWRFPREPDFLMVQMAVYLQDNTAEHGGGLTVVPGSHREPDRVVFLTRGHPRSLKNRVTRRVARGMNDVMHNRRARDIPSRAGDLVVFDLRLDHRATQPRAPIAAIPAAQRKLALFFRASANNDHARTYVQFLSTMDWWGHAGEEYPRAARDFAKQNEIGLV